MPDQGGQAPWGGGPVPQYTPAYGGSPGGGGPGGGNRGVLVVVAIAAALLVILLVVGLFVYRSYDSAGSETPTGPDPSTGPDASTAPGPDPSSDPDPSPDPDPSSDPDPSPTEPPAPAPPPGVEDAGPTNVFALRVGNCATASDYTSQSNDLVLTPCAEPHHMEFFHIFDVEDRDAYPGTATMNAEANQGCRAAWGELPDNALAEELVEMSTLSPSEATWAQGDREVLCIVRTVDGSDGLRGNFQDASVSEA